MAGSIAPGHLGNLTVAEERKLQEAWVHLLRLCGDESLNSSELLTQYPDRSSVFHQHLSDKSPSRFRRQLWSFVAAEHPDVLVLRFLRARKWNIDQSVSMLVSAVNWREDMRLDDTIIKTGEDVWLKDSPSSDDKDFIEQYRSGKSYIRGIDKENRAIYVVRVQLHDPSAQSAPSMEKFVLHNVESLRILPRHPYDKACFLFDMTGMSLRNVDFHVTKFLISVFEARYPETLGAVLVHNAPFIFWGVWRVIKPLMDPVIAAKINFTRSTADLLQFISKENLQKRYGGDDPWEYEYAEPVAGENQRLDLPDEKQKIQAERDDLSHQFEAATVEWVALKLEAADARAHNSKRSDLAKQLQESYWKLNPYIRAKTYYERAGIVDEKGDVDFSSVRLER